uniref:Succinate dehydrogenase assembly factor 4, mitochondrial n=1 Tax=Haptolina brevifila TaxID=156173 RepID=A0A7S2GPF4_9EUKA|mmetsp:Transcript_44318/g.88569  ORF Transcript_44318/g.88569 Transcript_44318/m.88569 type:complete len:152 (+) Transcript_44318:50-505(+)
MLRSSMHGRGLTFAVELARHCSRLELQARGVFCTKASPFAQPEPPKNTGSDTRKLLREEEQRERVEAMAKLMREKTMREVSAAGAARRPDGVKHMLDMDKRDGEVDKAIAKELGPQYAANYDADRDEWGGPKGAEPTRYGDWEVKGRSSDF